MAVPDIPAPSLPTAGNSRDAVLLVNLGTPEAPTRAAVRRYLKEFLWDARVVEGARIPWWLVLNLIILNTRPARSARAYQKVWTAAGSPLMDVSKKQLTAVADLLSGAGDNPAANPHLALAMRYGEPSIPRVLRELQSKGINRLLVVPMYPQYSATTTASVFDAVTRELGRWRDIPALHMLRSWHTDSRYIECLAASVREHWSEFGQADRLIMSFHGIPKDYTDAGDPYYHQCIKTGDLLAAALGLDESSCSVTFQSRVGPKQWLKPYTDETLAELPKTGVCSVQMICPGFSADCLETLEEVAMENREVFLSAGGERYEYIACLNDRPDHVRFLCELIQENIK